MKTNWPKAQLVHVSGCFGLKTTACKVCNLRIAAVGATRSEWLASALRDAGKLS